MANGIEGLLDGPEVVINIDKSSSTGFGRTQFYKLERMFEQMSDQLTALNAEVEDVRATQVLVLAGLTDLRANNDAAVAAIAALEVTVATLTEQATLDAATIATLTEQAASTATAIGETTVALDSIDEAFEDVTGENPPV